MDETGRTERIVVRFDLYKHRRKLQWASRIGSVYVKGKDSSLADTLKIYQYPLELSLSRKTLDFGMSAESRTVIVTTSHQDYDDIPLLELKLPEDAKTGVRSKSTTKAYFPYQYQRTKPVLTARQN